MAAERQVNVRPPAQPSYVFRGHAAPIHSVRIARRNSLLFTGDADGWIVVWRLASKRPIAVWKAHDAAILGTGEWGFDRLITHGRDNALRIWQLDSNADSNLSTVLPADRASLHRPKPWLLYSLPVNTLNFCAFSACPTRPATDAHASGTVDPSQEHESILVAVPATDDKRVDIYQLPEQKLAHAVPRVQLNDTGMVMAVKVTHHRASNSDLLIAGYEGGFTALHLLGPSPRVGQSAASASTPQLAQLVYLSRPHTQPVLSLDISPDGRTYFTSSADAIIAGHRLPDLPAYTTAEESPATTPPNGVSSDAHAPTESGIDEAQQPSSGSAPSETLASDEEAAPTSGVAAPLEPTAPLTFAKKHLVSPPKSLSGSQSLEGGTRSSPSLTSPSGSSKPSGLTSLLASVSPQPIARSKAAPSPVTELQTPRMTVQTKHAGQQSLQVRSDGRLLLTGGWDGRVRIYSTKTLKEMAVLKWHKDGVYAAGFGETLDESLPQPPFSREAHVDSSGEEQVKSSSPRGGAIMQSRGRMGGGLTKLQRQREEQIQEKHWVVAGSKDGNVSLWEIF